MTEFDPQRTALLTIDLQNDFLHPLLNIDEVRVEGVRFHNRLLDEPQEDWRLIVR